MSDITLILANKNYSSWSLRPWLALKQTGAPFEEVVIPLRQPETRAAILEHSPSGRVPALRRGDLTIWESLAICEYLAEIFPSAGLWPGDGTARAVARAVSAEMHGGFAALRQQCPMNVRANHPGRPVTAELQADIDRITGLWRDCRDRFGREGPFLFGGFTIADAMFAPVVSRFTTYAIPLDAHAAAYCAAVWSGPSMQEWKEASRHEEWVIEAYEFPPHTPEKPRAASDDPGTA